MADQDDDSPGGRPKRPRTSPEGVDSTDARLRVIELHLAEVIGQDGDGGSYRVLRKKVEKMEGEMDSFKTFKIKIVTTIGLATTLGTLIASLAGILIEHYK